MMLENYATKPFIIIMETVLERFNNSWSVDGSLEEKWQNVKDALTSAVSDVLGFSSRHQPDDSLGYLQPLLIYILVGMKLILNG